MNTAELLERLRRHYIKPGDALPGGMFLPEVTWGGSGGRRADALYVGFARSRGLHLIGHELKISRADWLHELESIEKAEVWASQCHGWILVVADPKHVRDGELPEGWGLMTPGPSKTRMEVLVRPTIDPTVQPSWTATHSILKRADTLRALAVGDAREKVRAEYSDLEAKVRQQQFDLVAPNRDAAELERANRLLADLAEILGVDLSTGGQVWHSSAYLSTAELRRDLGAFIRASHDGRTALSRRSTYLDSTARQLEEAAAEVRGALAALGRSELQDGR